MEMVYQQANENLKAFDTEDKEALIYNLVESLMFITEDVQKKVINCLKLVNEELGNTIERQLY